MRLREAWDTAVGWLAIALSDRVGLSLVRGEFYEQAVRAGWRLVPPPPKEKG